MYSKKTSKILILLLLSLILSSCSGYNRLIKSGDIEAIFTEAMRLYENESYAKTLQLFDRVAVFVKGTDKEEPLNYYYAQCYYHLNDFMLASYYFKKYVRQYPISDKAEECAFMSALCMYYQSPVYTLDQTPTKDAIKEMQVFINSYPNSERIEQCNEYIDEMRAKLEIKDYSIAMLYMKMEEYKAAIVSFENILRDYPGTERKEEIMCNIVKSGFAYANNSVSGKKNERFKKMIEDYQKFISSYPDSELIKDIEHCYKSALNYM